MCFFEFLPAQQMRKEIAINKTRIKERIRVVNLKGKIQRKQSFRKFRRPFLKFIRLSKRATSFLDVRNSSVDQCPHYCGFDERPLTKIMAERVRS